MLGAISNAVSGMMAASRRLEASAGRVAGAAVSRQSPAATGGAASPDVDYAVEAVEQITAKLDFAANAAVLRTTRDMTGRLLDMTA